MSLMQDLRPAIASTRVRLRRWSREGMMPFREPRPLTSGERQRVAFIWAAAGACFSCLWAAALVLVLPGLRGLAGVGVIAVLSAFGAVFFGLVALAVVSLFSRSFAHALPLDEPSLARDRQPLPLDTE
jgi:hypothetical protein